MAYHVTIDDITSAAARSLEKTQSHVTCQLRQASEEDVTKILTDTTIRHKIFPEKLCVNNFEPFDAIPENAFMMLRPYNWAFVEINQAGHYDSLSIMTTGIDIPAGCMFSIDYYGPISPIIAIRHVIKHLQKVISVYTKGPITVILTTPSGIKYKDLKNTAAFLKLKQYSLAEKMYVLQEPRM